MKKLTATLGTELRAFAKLTEGMNVRETQKEYSNRTQRNESTKSKASGWPKRKVTRKTTEQQDSDGRRPCALNLNTYKMHALGDYVRTIEQYGTTDSYSTQIVSLKLLTLFFLYLTVCSYILTLQGELQHRKVQAQYARTNRRGHLEQMTRIGDICDVLQDMDNELKCQQNQHSSPAELDVHALHSLLDGSG